MPEPDNIALKSLSSADGLINVSADMVPSSSISFRSNTSQTVLIYPIVPIISQFPWRNRCWRSMVLPVEIFRISGISHKSSIGSDRSM